MPEEWQIKAFIGENAAFYKRKWNEYNTGFFGGWHWVALFFSVEWLAYRKMYIEAVYVFLIPLIGYFIARRFSPIGEPRFVLLGMSLLANIFFAIFGLELYRRKLMRMIDENETQLNEQLLRTGGTSGAGLTAAVLFRLLFFL